MKEDESKDWRDFYRSKQNKHSKTSNSNSESGKGSDGCGCFIIMGALIIVLLFFSSPQLQGEAIGAVLMVLIPLAIWTFFESKKNKK